MIQSDNSLLMKNVTYADHGTYTCSAVSVLGNDSASAHLTVQGKPFNSLTPESTHQNHFCLGRRGRGDSHMKQTGMLVVSLKGACQ